VSIPFTQALPGALHPGTARYAVVKALTEALSALRRDGHTKAVRGMLASFEEYNRVVGLDEWLAPYRCLWASTLDALEQHLDAQEDR
jgi:hypothetical protein